MSNGLCAWLSDVDPLRDIYLLEVELEEWVVVDGLDHPADVVSDHRFTKAVAATQSDLVREEANCCRRHPVMDHAERVPPKARLPGNALGISADSDPRRRFRRTSPTTGPVVRSRHQGLVLGPVGVGHQPGHAAPATRRHGVVARPSPRRARGVVTTRGVTTIRSPVDRLRETRVVSPRRPGQVGHRPGRRRRPRARAAGDGRHVPP